MRTGLGIVTLAAVGAAYMVWFGPSATESGLSVVSGVGAGGVANLSSGRGTPPPSRTESTATETGAGSRFFGASLPATTSRAPAVAAEPAQAASKSPPLKAWSTDVVIYSGAREHGSDPVLTAPARVVSSSGANTQRHQARQDVARALQAELRRVGCYVGEIDGEWGPTSKRALRAFIDQVRSGSPGDEPDLIQLTLVRGYPGMACRAAPGQSNATITAARTAPTVYGPAIAPARPPFAASTPTFAAQPGTPSATVATATPDAPPSGTLRPASFEGRMGIGAQLSADVNQGEAGAPNEAGLPPPSQPDMQRPRSAQPRQRRERAWTANFFNQ